MSEIAPYGVSYIASAPEELKVGDRVELDNGEKGNVTTFYGNDKVYVLFDNEMYNGRYAIDRLRKLPDTISFEDNPLDKQVGGSHYKDMAIQPVEFCMKNKLDFCTSSAIKYLCRHKNKNGKEDLLKAKHFIDLLIQLEYPE